MLTTDHLSAAGPPPRPRSRARAVARAVAGSVAHGVLIGVLAMICYTLYAAFLVISLAMCAVIWPVCEGWNWAAGLWNGWRGAGGDEATGGTYERSGA